MISVDLCDGLRSTRRNCTGCDFAGRDLRGADLSNVSYVGVDFVARDLRGANMRGAKLTGVDFRNADWARF